MPRASVSGLKEEDTAATIFARSHSG
jgi:hypothetical protein